MKHKVTIIFLGSLFCISLMSCVPKESATEEIPMQEFTLTDEQSANLMEQCMEDQECFYDQYLPSKWIASCEVFGVEREKNSNIGYVYAYMLDEEYVLFKDKAYSQSGGHCPVKIKVEFDGDNIKYISWEVPADGDVYEDSMKELYPLKFYAACELYNPFDSNGEPKLNKKQEEKVKELWGVEVSKEYGLNIEEDGSYELTWTTDDESEVFEVRVKEKGKLEQIKGKVE